MGSEPASRFPFFFYSHQNPAKSCKKGKMTASIFQPANRPHIAPSLVKIFTIFHAVDVVGLAEMALLFFILFHTSSNLLVVCYVTIWIWAFCKGISSFRENQFALFAKMPDQNFNKVIVSDRQPWTYIGVFDLTWNSKNDYGVD